MQVPRTLDGSEITLVARATSSPEANVLPYVFQSNTTLGVKRQSLITFIQTDKPIYKPGQTVRFRILSIESDLRAKLGMVEKVWIENPSGIRMTQWLNVETEKGKQVRFGMYFVSKKIYRIVSNCAPLFFQPRNMICSKLIFFSFKTT